MYHTIHHYDCRYTLLCIHTPHHTHHHSYPSLFSNRYIFLHVLDIFTHTSSTNKLISAFIFLQVHQARDLEAKDRTIFGKTNTSDPQVTHNHHFQLLSITTIIIIIIIIIVIISIIIIHYHHDHHYHHHTSSSSSQSSSSS